MSLTPKTAGRAFGTKSLHEAYESVAVAAKLDDVKFRQELEGLLNLDLACRELR